ncbi:hypothetical protein Tsubulata_027240 [Turnera subulata]|uniref:Uncharacterized protein n=1 Tax=Turnera subulata TaxID=218843 RepID=A0A9Q0IXK6_9ROSI|nr:hypothetical protein Tsubulata_027240 [Turnera subulata]
MKNSKFCSAILPKWRNTLLRRQPRQHSAYRLDYYYFEDNTGNYNKQEYYQARRAFLSSYRFAEENDGFKDKLKKSVKGLNGAVMGAVSDARKEMAERRVGIKVLKITIALPSLSVVSLRCFTPWISKKSDQLMQTE